MEQDVRDKEVVERLAAEPMVQAWFRRNYDRLVADVISAHGTDRLEKAVADLVAFNRLVSFFPKGLIR